MLLAILRWRMIQLVAALLTACADPRCDLVGHIGGDDYIVIFQSPDWQARLRGALTEFDRARLTLFSATDIERGGFASLDRRGQQQFFPLTSLSVGAVEVAAAACTNAYEVAARAGEAKSQAKKTNGSNLFIDRRAWSGLPVRERRVGVATPTDSRDRARP